MREREGELRLQSSAACDAMRKLHSAAPSTACTPCFTSRAPAAAAGQAFVCCLPSLFSTFAGTWL